MRHGAVSNPRAARLLACDENGLMRKVFLGSALLLASGDDARNFLNDATDRDTPAARIALLVLAIASDVVMRLDPDSLATHAILDDITGESGETQ